MNRINSTRFLEVEELREKLEKLDLKEEVYKTGGVPLSASEESVWVDGSDSHTIIFGATGSKKTRLLVMPTAEILGRAGESFVVTDPKGEIHNRTAGSMQSKGYQVFTLNMRDYEAGESWNPLLLPYQYYRSGDIPKAVELISSVAGMLIGDGGKDDKFWFQTAQDVAIGLILFLFEEAGAESECNIRNLVSIWQRYMENRKKFNKEVKDKYGGSIIGDKLQCLDNPAERTVGSIEAVFATGLNKFSTNEKLMDYLSQSGMDFGTMTSQKTAVYLIIPDENKFYYFLVSLFLEQLYEVLIKTAQQSEDFRLPIRMNFLVDEFANLPAIDNMDSMITASRSRNIRFALVVQSMNQLTEKYGETAQVICSNCNNWIYLYSKEYDLLTQISKLCGEVIYDNNMRMPLMSEFDLQHLSKEKGETLVLCGRNYPCLVNLLDIDSYPFQRVPFQRERQEIKPATELGQVEEELLRTIGFLFGEPEESVFPSKEDEEEMPAVPEECVNTEEGCTDTDGEEEGNKEGKKYSCDFPKGWKYCALRSKGELGEDHSRLMGLFGFYKEMCVTTWMAKKNSILDGVAIMGACSRLFEPVEALHTQWYYASLKALTKYKNHLEEHPEQVYLTLKEIEEISGETLILTTNAYAEWGKNRKLLGDRWKEWLHTYDQSEIWNVSLRVVTDGAAEKISLCCMGCWEGELGMRYVCNRAFRYANEKLKGGKFETVNWEVSENQPKFRRIFCKKIDEENYAELILEYEYYVD